MVVGGPFNLGALVPMLEASPRRSRLFSARSAFSVCGPGLTSASGSVFSIDGTQETSRLRWLSLLSCLRMRSVHCSARSGETRIRDLNDSKKKWMIGVGGAVVLGAVAYANMGLNRPTGTRSRWRRSRRGTSKPSFGQRQDPAQESVNISAETMGKVVEPGGRRGRHGDEGPAAPADRPAQPGDAWSRTARPASRRPSRSSTDPRADREREGGAQGRPRTR